MSSDFEKNLLIISMLHPFKSTFIYTANYLVCKHKSKPTLVTNRILCCDAMNFLVLTHHEGVPRLTTRDLNSICTKKTASSIISDAASSAAGNCKTLQNPIHVWLEKWSKGKA